MKKLVVSLTFAAGLLASCAAPAPVTMSSTYNPQEVAWALANGNNTITGSAVLRTRGGDVKTCAGLPAALIPVSAYSSEFMLKTFGSTTSGISQYSPNITLDPAFGSTIRKTVCGPQGDFSFSNLPDGDYFVVGTVTWEAVSGGRYAYLAKQGGDMMQRVSVAGGETKSVVLTS